MQQNAANRADVRRAEKAAKLAEQQRREVIVAICGTTQGRTYFWTQLEDANVFCSVYDASAQRMAFNEGQRAAGLRLLADIMTAAPEQFIQMMVESNGRRTASEQPRGQDRDGRDQGSGAGDGEDGDDEVDGNAFRDYKDSVYPGTGHRES